MCDCIAETNKLLEPKGVELDLAYFLTGETPKVTVATTKLPGKKRGCNILIPSLCPFCGEKYPE